MTLKSLLSALFVLLVTSSAWAQSAFSPAITVNDSVISSYELDQRAKLLTLFRTPGNVNELAREQLIEERLKESLLKSTGRRLSEEALATEVEAFAGRANLTTEQFTTILAQNGVDKSTLEQFVRMGVSWRDYIRARYRSQVVITDADIDRAIAQSTGGADGIEVLLSEIIIPAPPPRAAQAMAQAERISQLTSFAAFEAQARQVSALPSRVRGGRLNWLPISNYPPAVQSIILDLSPGEVTAPLPITNGVALFQMRDIREIPQAAPVPTEIDYAAFYIGGGEGSLAAAQSLAPRIDTCDDLYGAALGQPEEVLDRVTVAPSEIPQDIALELAKLDPNELSYNLTRNGGQTRVLVMLCERVTENGDGIDRETVRGRLLSQRLASRADALLAEMMASAKING